MDCNVVCIYSEFIMKSSDLSQGIMFSPEFFCFNSNFFFKIVIAGGLAKGEEEFSSESEPNFDAP